MASSRDAQDILDLKQTDATARPKKKGSKPKLVRPKHIPKEVWLLETQGDRAPPVALTAIQPKKPKFTRRVKPFEWQPFTHPNRKDGLVLYHWAKKAVDGEAQNGGPATPADAATAAATEAKTTKTEPQVNPHWSKYNVKIDVPKYTSEEYEKHLVSDEWSKEETDYLISLVEDFDLRWVVVADRYDYQTAPSETNEDDSMAVVQAPKTRTMEDMKTRYYKVASAMMAVHQPLSSMTGSEFSLYEKMTKFNPVNETKRKLAAEQLLLRTDQEIEEEKRLLAELKRIVQDEDDFIAERQELYDRLNAPSSRPGNSMYETSTGLAQLGQQLAAQDRNRSRQYQLAQQQRRQIAGLDDKDKSNSPAAPPTAGLSRGNSDMRRSVDGLGPSRKDSKAGQQNFVQRTLSEREERRYGVQRPEKLLAGEKIRHVRIEKRVTARASSVAAKVQDAMIELKIPIRPVMSTQRITEGYEQICNSLDALLETRRHAEKTENEIKVLLAQKEARENKTEDGQTDGAADAKADDAGQSKAEEKDTADETQQANVNEDTTKDEEEADKDQDEDEEDADEQEREEDEDEAEEADTGAPDVDEDEDNDNAVKADSDDEDVGDDGEEGGEGEEEADEEEEDGIDDETPAPDADDDDGQPTNAEEESRPSTRASRKRSVSVLSSSHSQKGIKKQKK